MPVLGLQNLVLFLVDTYVVSNVCTMTLKTFIGQGLVAQNQTLPTRRPPCPPACWRGVCLHAILLLTLSTRLSWNSKDQSW